MHHYVEITHPNQWYLYLVFYLFKLGEKYICRHTITESYCTSLLYHRTISQRVAEGHSHLNHVYASSLQRTYHISCTLYGRTSCTEIYRQQFTILTLGEQFVYLVHLCCFLYCYLIFAKKAFSASTFLTAGAVSNCELRSMPANIG